MVFLIDLPRLNNNQLASEPEETFFGRELRRFLRALGLEDSLVKSLDHYDFSETRRYGFVHSMYVKNKHGSGLDINRRG